MSFRYDFQKNAPMLTTTMAICPHVYNIKIDIRQSTVSNLERQPRILLLRRQYSIYIFFLSLNVEKNPPFIHYFLFLSIMNCINMCFQVSCLRKFLSTNVAFVIFLSIMNCINMSLQISSCRKCLST